MTVVQFEGEGFLLEGRTLLNNALKDAEILELVKSYGYGEARINEGLALLKETENLILKQKDDYGGRQQATADLQTAWEKANKEYMKTLKIARIALRDNQKAVTSLMLSGDRRQDLLGWLEQALAFYQNMVNNAAMASAMEKFGYTLDKLKAEGALVSDVAQKSQTQKNEKGEAQQSTQERDKKIAEMDRWISEFRTVCRVALGNSPQMLEKLGIVVLNEKRAKKASSTTSTATAAK